MTTMRRALPIALLLLAACAASGPLRKPNEREWSLLMADYQWIQTLRAAQKPPPETSTRKQQIEARLDQHRKVQPTLDVFIGKLTEYHQRTGDARAPAILAREKIFIGDEYVNFLSRYDTGIARYREALAIDPGNEEATRKIAEAESRRFVSMTAFASVKPGMREGQVQSALGIPREDWIKQVVQKSRVYAVWIYPRSDGGASAVYFDNGIVYHTNWNAAAPARPKP